jgi:hypothetical protein
MDQARAAAPFRHNKTYRLKTSASKIRDNEMSTTVQAVNVKRSVTGLIFAGLGGLFLVLEIHTFASWMLSPEFHATPVGADAVPANVKSIIDHYQISNSVMGVLALLWFIQGIIRHRRIGPVRLMMVGWLSAYWLDPWLSFLRPVFTYNAYAFNRGCWCTFIPFWQNPSGARIAEPLLIDPSSYFYNFTLVAVLAWVVMRWARKQRPSLSTPALVLIGFVVIWCTMSLLDIVATRYFGFDAWPISFRAATLWAGQPYQFPIYEFVLFPTAFVASALVLLSTRSNGLTAIESGLEGFSSFARTVLRVLVFIGFCNLTNLLYTTAFAVQGLAADGWPQNMPSWLADEQCGPKTGIACRSSGH